MLRTGNRKCLDCLIIQKIREKEQPSEEWIAGLTVKLQKKGDLSKFDL